MSGMERTNPVPGTKIDKTRIISLEKGKIPPQAVDLEEAVLGAMMIDKKGIDDVIDILHPDAFYDTKLATGRYFLDRFVPEGPMHLAKMKAGADSMMALDAEAM